jgi:hypothetical protein
MAPKKNSKKVQTTTKPTRRASEPAQPDEDIPIRGIDERYNASDTRRNSDRCAIPEPSAPINIPNRPTLGPGDSILIPSQAIATTTATTISSSTSGRDSRGLSPDVIRRPSESFMGASPLLQGVGLGLASLAITHATVERNKKREKAPDSSDDEALPKKRVRSASSSSIIESTRQNTALENLAQSSATSRKRGRRINDLEEDSPSRKRARPRKDCENISVPPQVVQPPPTVAQAQRTHVKDSQEQDIEDQDSGKDSLLNRPPKRPPPEPDPGHLFKASFLFDTTMSLSLFIQIVLEKRANLMI